MDMSDMKSKEKLKAFFAAEITSLFSDILDLTEVALGDVARQKILRSKILKIANSSIRSVNKEVEDKYDIQYIPPSEDIVIVRK